MCQTWYPLLSVFSEYNSAQKSRIHTTYNLWKQPSICLSIFLQAGYTREHLSGHSSSTKPAREAKCQETFALLNVAFIIVVEHKM